MGSQMMDQGIHQGLALVEGVVGDLQRIAHKLVSLSKAGLGRGMLHTEGVDALISFVDRMEHASSAIERQAGSAAESERKALELASSGAAAPSGAADLPDLCEEVRRKGADLDRLNREGVRTALEVSEQAAEISRVESKLREWLDSVREAPTA